MAKRISKAACVLCIALPLVTPVTAGEDSKTLTLDEARQVAAQALRVGKPELARTLAMGLVKADPKDAFAYGVLAAAHSSMENPDLARAAARLSYKYSTSKDQSFAAARTAGRVAYQQERFTASQLWLRRAALHASNDRKTELLGREYAQVRAANPLGLRFNLSIAPSDNVNNGSDATLLIVDGEPQPGGTIANSSRALSGVVATANANLTYRLKRTRTSQTSVTARAYTRRVALSSASRAAAPSVTNSELGSSLAEVGLRHRFVLNKKGGVMALSGSMGRAWSAGTSRYSFGKLQVNPTFKLSPTTTLSLNGSVEKRWSTIDPINDQTVTQMRAMISHKLAKGDRISFGLNVLDMNSDARNGAYQSGNLTLNYSFGKKIGPMKLSAGLTVGYTDFDIYGLPVPLPNGRQDLSLYGDVTMIFTDYDVAGFAPTVRLRTGRKSSNVSRFETREVSVSLGIQSKF